MKTIFAIFGTSNVQAMSLALQQNYPLDFFEISPGQWFLVASGTAKDVSDKLGITAGTVGTGVVVSVSGYFGLAAQNIWEWLAAKLKAGQGV